MSLLNGNNLSFCNSKTYAFEIAHFFIPSYIRLGIRNILFIPDARIARSFSNGIVSELGRKRIAQCTYCMYICKLQHIIVWEQELHIHNSWIHKWNVYLLYEGELLSIKLNVSSIKTRFLYFLLCIYSVLCIHVFSIHRGANLLCGKDASNVKNTF